jgi:hypothetical protein
MRDMASTLSSAIAIAAATYAADTTPPAIDLAGYEAATIFLHIGAGGITFSGTNKIEFVLTHSDDNSTYTNVTAADLVVDALAPGSITSGIVRALVAAHAAATVQEIGYVGSKRYLKLLADFSGTHGTGTPIAATVARGMPYSGPV